MRRKNPKPEPTSRRAKSIGQFCSFYGISRPTFARWCLQGIGPELLKCGGRTIVTPTAEDKWVASRTVTKRRPLVEARP